MDKSKIIKILIGVIIATLALVYYFTNKDTNTDYESILSNDVVIQNEIAEEKNIEKSKIKVYVIGEVNAPGVYELEEGSRIEDVVKMAGGMKPDADMKNINLAYEVSDGEKIYIPNIAEAGEEESDCSQDVESNNSQNSGKVNINKATVSELAAVRGIGKSTAQKIVEYREDNGKFKSIEDIKNVKGIKDGIFENIKDYITVK